MGYFVEVIKSVYRILPFFIQQSVVAKRLKMVFWKLVGHQTIYDSDFSKYIDEPAVRSADTIATSIVCDLKPGTVIDVGCGTGALLVALRQKGCNVFGLEYSDACLGYCKARNLDVRKCDLEHSDFEADRLFDVAVSIEVAEHLPESCADRFVTLLTRLSSQVVFTAAPPGQGGRDHVNEQPPSYWIAKFRHLGFDIDEGLSDRWRQCWEATGGVESWYYKNLMVFRRNDEISS